MSQTRRPQHPNAALTPAQRLKMVRLVVGGDFPADLRRAIAVVAERHNLASDWVNAGAVVGNAALEPRPQPLYVGRNFQAYSPDDRYLLAMKLFANRERDFDDAVRLSEETGIITTADPAVMTRSEGVARVRHATGCNPSSDSVCLNQSPLLERVPRVRPRVAVHAKLRRVLPPVGSHSRVLSARALARRGRPMPLCPVLRSPSAPERPANRATPVPGRRATACVAGSAGRPLGAHSAGTKRRRCGCGQADGPGQPLLAQVYFDE